jgi:hypothetical protein
MTGVDQNAVKSLLDSRKAIQGFLWEKRVELAALRSTKSVGDADLVIELADNLTMCARAPEHWVSPRPLHEFKGHPPAPQFEQMRAGWLERYNQKQLKAGPRKGGEAAGEEKEESGGLRLLKFERTGSSRRPSTQAKERSKRGRDEGVEEDEGESKNKRPREEEESAPKVVAEDLGARKATGISFGLDASDSDSDSE